MMQSVDLRGVEQKAADPFLLQAYLQQLIGQPFLHFRFSYGDELSLHFGLPRSYESPKMKHLVKGSYILGTRASRWFLRSEARPTVIFGGKEFEPQDGANLQSLSKKDLETADIMQRGARIVFASSIPFSFPFPGAPVFGFGLSLSLSDGASILIAPESVETLSLTETIADWELFTPYERLLRVGPGVQWSYLPSRQSLSPQPAAADPSSVGDAARKP